MYRNRAPRARDCRVVLARSPAPPVVERRIQGMGFSFRVLDFGLRDLGVGVEIWASSIWGLRFTPYDSGFGVWA